MSFLSRINEFHDQAAKASGLDDFGSADYVEPMKLILSDYDNCEGFTPLGQQLAAGQMVAMLAARLHAIAGFRKYPAYADAGVQRPIIIIGQPRTGSTSLHRLLAEDPHSQSLVPWLGSTPVPRPPRDTWETNPLYQASVEGFRQFYQAIPKVNQIHPQGADLADECRYGIEPCFWSPALSFLGPFGKYAEWFPSADAHYAYQHYRKVLGLIAGEDKRHWILKDPTTHLWVPEVLLDTFPDACLVYTHRHPMTTMTSVTSMMYAAREPREANLTREEHARQQLSLWGPAVAKNDAFVRQLDLAQVCDVHINELRDDPVGMAERIYRHFNLTVPEETRQAWQNFVDKDARGGHGEHHYQQESWGFTEKEVYDITGSYYDNYRKMYGEQV